MEQPNSVVAVGVVVEQQHVGSVVMQHMETQTSVDPPLERNFQRAQSLQNCA